MSPQYGELRPTSGWDHFISWSIPANFNGFCVLAVLLHGTLVVGVSQTLRRWTEGATYIRRGGHHVGHWPTFLVIQCIAVSTLPMLWFTAFMQRFSKWTCPGRRPSAARGWNKRSTSALVLNDAIIPQLSRRNSNGTRLRRVLFLLLI